MSVVQALKPGSPPGHEEKAWRVDPMTSCLAFAGAGYLRLIELLHMLRDVVQAILDSEVT